MNKIIKPKYVIQVAKMMNYLINKMYILIINYVQLNVNILNIN